MDLEIKPHETLILVVDIQDRLAGAMHSTLFPRLVENMGRLAKAAEGLKIPVVMSEQYPKGLGATIDPVRQAFKEPRVMEKMVFDAAKDEGIAAVLRASGRKKILVTGMETHVCVYQTVRSLAREYTVHLVRDAVA